MPKAQDDDLVMNLVELALAQAPDTRETYVRSACGADTALFQEVWDYVESEQRMQGFLLDPLFPPPAQEHSFEPGTLLSGRFRIVREVAQGGMGVVYEAEDERLGRRVALKCAKQGFGKRLPPEVRHASEISHPNVCRIFEIHTASTDRGDIDFITMEFLEGETLFERLSRGRLPERQARDIARQICAGLAEAHRHRVVHGDLKSNNVILAVDLNGGTRAVITDFGLARNPAASEASAGPSGSTEAAGTPDYMAPELWKGSLPSASSDVFALGVILYELAAGRRPYPRDVSWQDRLTRTPAPVSPRWDPVLRRCMSPDASKRFRGAAEVAAALEPVQTRRWWLTAAAGVVLVGLTGLVTYQRMAVPKESVRLAVLPFEADSGAAPLSEGLLLETSDRLNHLKPGSPRRLTLIPLSDALQQKVSQPAKAKSLLGAAYALHGTLRKQGDRIVVTADLTDTSSLVHLKEWQGEYTKDQLHNMPVALAGMVTGTLNLPPLAIAPTVNPAAYSDFVAAESILAKGDQELDRAISLMERAASLDSNSPLTWAGLAEAQWRKAASERPCAACVAPLDSHFAELARASLKSAEQRNPDVAAVKRVSGRIHEYYGQYDQARIDLERAIAIDPPGDGETWRRLARVYEGNDQMNEALQALLKAVEVQPGYFRNYQGLGNFYNRQDDPENATRAFKEMVRLAPDMSEAHYSLALPYLNTARYEEGEYELNLARKFQETQIVMEGFGMSRMYQGRDPEAIPYFQRALELGPPSSLYYLNLGTSLRRAGFTAESKQAYRTGQKLASEALGRNYRNAYERASLAYLDARLDEREEAEHQIEQALNASRNQVRVRWFAALTYEALGERGRTLSVIRDVPAVTLDRLSRFPDLGGLRSDRGFQDLLHSSQIK